MYNQLQGYCSKNHGPVCLFPSDLIAFSKSWFFLLAFLLYVSLMCCFSLYSSLFFYSLIYSLYSILLSFCPFSPRPPSAPPWSFIPSISISPSRLSAYALVPLHHLALFIAHCPSELFISLLFCALSLSVLCVSRTLMVTQTFWLLAVPWGWDAVSALRLEVLYNLHTASYNKHPLVLDTVLRMCFLKQAETSLWPEASNNKPESKLVYLLHLFNLKCSLFESVFQKRI